MKLQPRKTAGLGGFIAVALVGLLVFGHFPVAAQESPQASPEESPQESPEESPEESRLPPPIPANTTERWQMMRAHIIKYLASEKVVVAGVGFANARIGDPMASLTKIWGQPAEARKVGVLRTPELVYKLEPHLSIIFSGRSTIKSIAVEGNSTASFRTRRGVRLGMSALTITRLYARKQPKKVRNRLELEHLGIDFHFTDNRLSRLEVYAPK